MKQFMKNYSLGALACIVMGAALIIDPHIITNVLNTAVGIILIAWGGIGILNFVVSRSSERIEDAGIFSLIGNVLVLGAGAFVFMHTDLLEKIVMLALGFYLFCSGLPKVITAVKMKKGMPEKWLMPFITSSVSTILGAVILCWPTKVSGEFMRFVGIMLVAAGVLSFMGGFSTAKYVKKVTRELEEAKDDIKYKKGKMKDKKDTHAEDKAKAIDVDAD